MFEVLNEIREACTKGHPSFIHMLPSPPQKNTPKKEFAMPRVTLSVGGQSPVACSKNQTDRFQNNKSISDIF